MDFGSMNNLLIDFFLFTNIKETKMRTLTARMSSNFYAIRCNFIYGSVPAYFNYQKIMGEIQSSFTVSSNIALFYTLEQREEAELYLINNLKKYDVKSYVIEKM
jgi:hypothetical protein